MENSNETKVIRFDWASKHILRQKANFDILEGFLTSLLNTDIKIINLLESESNQEDETDKFNRVDLHAVDEKGDHIIVEIQNDREVHYLERLLFGTSKLIVENMDLGDVYKKVKKVISVSILYFTLGDMVDDYVYYGSTEFRGVHSNNPLILKRKEARAYKKIEAKNLFPEYYLIEVEKFEDIINCDLDEWIYFFRHEIIRDDFKAKNIDKAKEKLDILKMNPVLRKKYERYLMNLASEKDIIETAREDGLEEGEKKGVEKGVEKGKKEGKKEEKNLIGKKLKNIGVGVDIIMNTTGLTENEIGDL